MNSNAPMPHPSFSESDAELLSCLTAAPNHEVAAEWLGCSGTHLRRLLKLLRERFQVETNLQLIALAAVDGAVDPRKVLPFADRDAV